MFFSLFSKLYKTAADGCFYTSRKMKFSTQEFSSKCDQIHRKLRIWSHLLKKPLMENFIFCAVLIYQIYLFMVLYTTCWLFKVASFNYTHNKLAFHKRQFLVDALNFIMLVGEFFEISTNNCFLVYSRNSIGCVAQWLVTCSRNPKVPGSSLAATYVQR